MEKSQVLLIALAFVVNIASIVLGYFNGSQSGGLFHHNISYLSDKYHQEVTPAGATFSIWGLIYFWNFVGILYIVISICLPANSSPVNYKPTLIPKSFLFVYSITFGTLMAWLFVFDREMLGASFAVLITGAFSGYTTVGILCKNVYNNLPSLEKRSQSLLWSVRIILQNGLALLATWMTVATSLGFGMLLTYKDSPDSSSAQLRGLLSMEDVSTLVMLLLLLLAMVWFVLENFLLKNYCSPLFTPFPVLIVAFTGILVKLQHAPLAKRNFIVSCVGVGICGVLFLVRIGLSIYRLVASPAYVKFDKSKEKLVAYSHCQ